MLFDKHCRKDNGNAYKIADALSQSVKPLAVMNSNHGSNGIVDMDTWPKIGCSIMTVNDTYKAGQHIIPWEYCRS